jgi:16S rRNA (cytosine967-C5)-methyltransferase
MARSKMTTTSRAARGRERALAAEALPLALEAALDAIARHRATNEPLERAVADVTRARHLGGRERRAVGDLVFGWARRREPVEQLVDDALARAGGVKPSRRDRDLCALLVVQAAGGSEPDARGAQRLDPVLAAVLDDVVARGLSPDKANALPAWLDVALARAVGEQAPALVASLTAPAPLVLAVDPARAAVDDVIAAIEARRAKAARSPVAPGAIRVEGRVSVRALPDEIAAAVWPMDDGSQAVARAVGALAGEAVLDLCAGGGGKTRLLTTTGARVVSADVSLERLRAARSAWRVVSDGLAPAFRAKSFDRVLVDAPCSGTGTLRRAPDLAQRLDPKDVDGFAAVQRRLLENALDLTKPGGLVVYATCSLLREENDDVVDAVLAARPQVRPAPIPWGDDVKVDGSSGRARLLPHIHGTDGFFVATLRAP